MADFRQLSTMNPYLGPTRTVQRITTGYSIEEPISYVGEGQRKFQAYRQEKYLFPVDGEEQDRLDLQHTMLSMLFDRRLYMAPIHEPRHVLDVATGTGIWAMEFAEQHLTSSVIGTDLSLIQPGHKRGLTNCDFVREDSEELWVHPHKFDYVHLRMVFTCFDDTRTVMRHAFDNMNPGGWIEFQDGCLDVTSFDASYEGTAFQRWVQLVILGYKRQGRDAMKARYYRQWLVEVGFVDVVERRITTPSNDWPGDPKLRDVGIFSRENLVQIISSIGLKILPAAGVTPMEAQKLEAQVLLDVRNPAIHAHFSIYVVFARKS